MFLLSAKISWLSTPQCTGDNTTKLPFSLLRRAWAGFSLKCSHCLPSSAWHKSLKANVMENPANSRLFFSLKNYTYKCICVCVHVWSESAYCSEQLPQREGKLSFIPVKRSNTESLALQRPYVCTCHSSEAVSAAPCILGCAAKCQETKNTV